MNTDVLLMAIALWMGCGCAQPRVYRPVTTFDEVEPAHDSPGERPPAACDRAVRRGSFADLDTNGDGYLTAEEVSHQDWARLRELDADGNERLEETEYQALHREE